jgi:hypothetical protein
VSKHWTWWSPRKGATLNLAKLSPKLEQIHLESHWHDWLASVTVGETTYCVPGETRDEALAELLNDDELLEALRTEATAESG